MISLRERFQGAMLGVLVGDALGAPYETWTREKIAEDFTKRGGLTFFPYRDPWHPVDGKMFPAGRPTDDSEMTAALAESLIAEDDLAQLYQRFRQCVVEEKSFLCDLPAYGFGGTTRRALAPKTLAEARTDFGIYNDPKTGEPIPSNGALMRTVPIALRWHKFGFGMNTYARWAAQITHVHPDAFTPAVFYCRVLGLILNGKSFEEAVKMVGPGITSWNGELKKLFVYPPLEPKEAKKFGGSASYTLKVALWAVGTSQSFVEGIEKAVANGSDTDTYAAVAGGLLGAIYGVQGIPEDWRTAVLGGARMIELADQLYEQQQK